MGANYRQFCPVAKAMELLDERWTLLLIRELMLGSERFNDLRRGLPAMSPSLLSKRLRQLVAAGVVDQQTDGGETRYLLSAAGQELRPVIEAVGQWGTRWIGELGDADLDPKLLLWDMHRSVVHDALPPGRTVLHFRFRDLAGKLGTWWLVLTDEEADVCDADPGYPVTLDIETGLRTLTEIWRGDRTWADALRSEQLRIAGPQDLRRAVPSWFTLSTFAAVPRAFAESG